MGRSGHVVEERRTFGQGDRCSKPTAVVSKLGQFHSPHFARVFLKETLRAVGPFYLGSMPGEVKIPHSEMEKNLLWTQCVS